MIDGKRIAVVVPCYRVRAQVLDVIGAIGEGVDAIYVVDDACPEGSGDLVAASAAIRASSCCGIRTTPALAPRS